MLGCLIGPFRRIDLDLRFRKGCSVAFDKVAMLPVSKDKSDEGVVSKTFMVRSGEVEAIKVHHLVPGGDEVAHELLPRVGTAVDFSQGSELGV
jgi:hypothetical protein